MSPAHPEKWPVLIVHGGLEEQLLKDCVALLAAAEESDGNPSLSEQTVVTLRAGDSAEHSLLTLALYAPDEDSDPSSGQDLAGLPLLWRSRTAAECWKLPSTPATATRAWRTGLSAHSSSGAVWMD
ncbi:mycothiol acetyltransferase [Arthrobacter sp. Hiyo4]|nr:mycothiol acetyltransferase [Arthrobacter sp. Hiyo4]